MRTQSVVATRLRALFPAATSTGAGRSGSDVLHTPGIALEVKARTGFDPLAWLRQARTGVTGNEMPAVVFRCNGQGEATVDDWPVLLHFSDYITLLAAAGFGGVTEEDNPMPTILSDAPRATVKASDPYVPWSDYLVPVTRDELAQTPPEVQRAVVLAMEAGYKVGVRRHPGDGVNIFILRATRAPGVTVWWTPTQEHYGACSFSTSRYGARTMFKRDDLATVLAALKTEVAA